MISYAKISEMVRYIKEKRLWAEWQYGTRCWEYPWVLENGKFETGLKCLDAGCGRSPIPAYLYGLGCEAHGLDYLQGEKGDYPDTYGIPKSWIKTWDKKILYHHGTLFDAPFPDNTFDRITCLSVLEHILTPKAPHAHYPALKEMKRILKPGGLLIITVDYFLNQDVTPDYDYRDDISFLQMDPFVGDSYFTTREEMIADEDIFVIPPQMYMEMGFGQGFNKAVYHRLTSVGYILQKSLHESQ